MSDDATSVDPLAHFRIDGQVAIVTGASSGIGARAARVLANGSVEPSMLMRSPGAPCSGCRGFQPVKVASGAWSSTGRIPGRSLPSSSTDGTKLTNGAPIFGGSSWRMPRAASGPKSSRRGVSIRSGKRTPGIPGGGVFPGGERGFPSGERAFPPGEVGPPRGKGGSPRGEGGLPTGERGFPGGERGLPSSRAVLRIEQDLPALLPERLLVTLPGRHPVLQPFPALDRRPVLGAAGQEIDRKKSVLGTLVTVHLDLLPDGSKRLLTLVLPDVLVNREGPPEKVSARIHTRPTLIPPYSAASGWSPTARNSYPPFARKR